MPIPTNIHPTGRPTAAVPPSSSAPTSTAVSGLPQRILPATTSFGTVTDDTGKVIGQVTIDQYWYKFLYNLSAQTLSPPGTPVPTTAANLLALLDDSALPQPGPRGAAGPVGFGFDGDDGQDGQPIPSQASQSTGTQAAPTLAIPGMDGVDGDDGQSAPGAQGTPGAQGPQGVQGNPSPSPYSFARLIRPPIWMSAQQRFQMMLAAARSANTF